MRVYPTQRRRLRRENDLERNQRAVMIRYENLTAKVTVKEHLNYVVVDVSESDIVSMQNASQVN